MQTKQKGKSILKIYLQEGSDSLGQYELDGIDADAVWYNYWIGSYEGMGNMILRKGDKYWLHDMGHCSCYGPTDHLSMKGEGQTLDEIETSCSKEYLKDVQPLISLARNEKRSNT